MAVDLSGVPKEYFCAKCGFWYYDLRAGVYFLACPVCNRAEDYQPETIQEDYAKRNNG